MLCCFDTFISLLALTLSHFLAHSLRELINCNRLTDTDYHCSQHAQTLHVLKIRAGVHTLRELSS